MAQPANPLVGRKPELELVERLLDRSCAGEARFLFVGGEAGIGKTRLLGELQRLGDERGCLTLHGGAAEFERELPFGLVVDALDEFLESLDPGVLSRLPPGDLAELSGVLPALRPLAHGSAQPTTAAERFRAHRALASLLERLSLRRPVVLALDDLHWADAASLELVAHLLRRPPRAAVLVAATYRKGQVDRMLVSALERHLSDTGASIELGPLRPADARALLDGLDEQQHAVLYEAAGGNPFYLLELARLGTGDGIVQATGAEDLGVPAAVAAATVAELDGLSGAGRRLVEGAAVAGDPFELGLAAAGASLEEAAALDAVDELVGRDLVHPTRVPRRFRFRHPLVRRAVYESCAAGKRIAAHRRTAQALEARGAPVTARAHHVEQSAGHGDLEAVAVLTEAGEAAARRAPVSAARWFSAALELLPDTAPAAERVSLLMARASAQASTGRFEEGRAALLESIELTADTDEDLRFELTRACAGVEQLLGRHETARGRLVTALDGMDDSSSPRAVTLMVQLAAGDFYRMDYEGMRRWGRRALVVAERLDPPLAAASLSVLAVAAAFRGPPSEAESFTSAAAILADTLADEELEAHLDALTNLCAAELYLHRYHGAEAHAARGLAIAAASGQGEVVPFLRPVLATVLLHTGRIPDAAAVVDETIELTRLSGNRESLGWSLTTRAYVAAMAGELELAVEVAEECMEVTEELDDRLIATYARWALATALLEKGEAGGATEALAAAAEGKRLTLIPEWWRAHYLELLTRCRLALGEHAEAARAAAGACAVAGRIRCQAATAMAERAVAAVALANGDPATAADRALAAAATARAAGARVDAARARTLAGAALAATGERKRAVAELEEAVRELRACEARRYRAEAEHELRRLGRRFSGRTRPLDAAGQGVATLTGRELEVAQLVVDRRTNPEIAHALVLSEKTIETHMRNIFRKLGVSSRADVARAVERAERAAG